MLREITKRMIRKEARAGNVDNWCLELSITMMMLH